MKVNDVLKYLYLVLFVSSSSTSKNMRFMSF
jgi:hypothetical protein